MASKYNFFDEYCNVGTGISDFDLRAISPSMRRFNLHTEEFHDYWNDMKSMLQKLFQTKNDIIAVTGSIRVAFDVIIGSITEPNDKVLVFTNGYWGSYVTRVVESFGGTPIIIQEESTKPVRVERAIEELKKNRDVKAVSIMHTETDTGLVNPIAKIGDAVKKYTKALYIVDCASSFAGMKMDIDKWNADFAFSGSHKCLSGPVGLAFIAVSKRGWDTIRSRKIPIQGTYINPIPWLKPIKGECEPPIPALHLHINKARIERIFDLGLEKHFKRHEIAAKALRIGLLKMGLSLLADCGSCKGCDADTRYCSNVVTTIKYPRGVKSEKLDSIMKRYGYPLGSAPYRFDCFLLGTINEMQVNPRHILSLLTCLGLAMTELGVKIKLEESLKSANNILKGFDRIRIK